MKLKAMTKDTVTVELTTQELSEMVNAHDITVGYLGEPQNEIEDATIKHHHKLANFWFKILVLRNNW